MSYLLQYKVLFVNVNYMPMAFAGTVCYYYIELCGYNNCVNKYYNVPSLEYNYKRISHFISCIIV